jgi:hypothetical protein
MSPPSITWILAISWRQSTRPPWNPVPQNALMDFDIHIFHKISNLKTQMVSVVSPNLYFLSQLDIYCLLTVGVEFVVAPIHTHTFGWTPLHDWSAPRRDLYLTTHNVHNRQTSIPLAWFEPAIPASGRPQTYAQAYFGAATGTDGS